MRIISDTHLPIGLRSDKYRNKPKWGAPQPLGELFSNIGLSAEAASHGLHASLEDKDVAGACTEILLKISIMGTPPLEDVQMGGIWEGSFREHT